MHAILAIEFRSGIEDAWSDVAQFIPRLVGALAVFVIGWLIARVIRRVVGVVLTKVRFDALVDRSGVGATVERAGYPDTGALVAKVVYYAVLLLALQLAISVFGSSPVQEALDGIIAFLPQLLVAGVIVLVTGAVAGKVRDMVSASTTTDAYRSSLATGAALSVWVVGGFAAINQLGVAQDVVNTLFQALVLTASLTIVVKFGVGGIWAARDRFWTRVYDRFENGGREVDLEERPAGAASDRASDRDAELHKT